MQVYVQTGPDAGRTFSLERPVVVIGRQIGTDITINDSQVSRRHAQLDIRGPNNVTITDLGSANGTFVNGRRVGVQPEMLKPGDSVRLGSTTLAFEMALAGQPTTLPGPVPSFSAYGPAFDFEPPAPVPPPYAPTTPFIAARNGAPPIPVPPPQPAPSASVTPAPSAAPSQTVVAPPPKPASKAEAVEKKPGNSREVIIGLVATLVILALLAFAILNLFPGLFAGNTSSASSTPSVVPAATAAQGQNGTNPLPPGPTTVVASVATTAVSVPTATAIPTRAPTTTPVPVATTAPSTAAIPTAPAGRKVVQGFGANFAVPSDWLSQATDDGTQAKVAAQPPTGNDAAVILYRLSTSAVTSDATTRLNDIIQGLKTDSNTKSMTAQPVKTLPNGATVLIDMTTAQGVALRLYIFSTQNAQNIPYVVLMQARQERYSAYSAIFDEVVKTLTFSGS